MKKEKFRSLLLTLLRLILALIFLIAAIEKLKSPENFALSIDAYEIFSNQIINFLTIFIPWLELFISFGLIFKFKLRANLVLYIFLMSVFMLIVTYAMIIGLDIECGCFGDSSEKVGWKKILENALIIFGAIILLMNEKFETTSSINSSDIGS